MVNTLTVARTNAASLRRKADEVRVKKWTNFESAVYDVEKDASTPKV